MSDDLREIATQELSSTAVERTDRAEIEIDHAALRSEDLTNERSVTALPIEGAARFAFYPTWRSQLLVLIGILILGGFSIWASRVVPVLVYSIRLFAIGDTQFVLDTPLLMVLPAAILARALVNIYDAEYVVSALGVETSLGKISFHPRYSRLRWEDICGVEPSQTMWERSLGIGSVLVGSAMTNDVEIVMEGVPNPRAIQHLIANERDRRMELVTVN